MKVYKGCIKGIIWCYNNPFRFFFYVRLRRFLDLNEAAAAAAAEKPLTGVPRLTAQTVPAAALFGKIEAASEASVLFDIRYDLFYELHELVNVQTHTLQYNNTKMNKERKKVWSEKEEVRRKKGREK